MAVHFQLGSTLLTKDLVFGWCIGVTPLREIPIEARYELLKLEFEVSPIIAETDFFPALQMSIVRSEAEQMLDNVRVEQISVDELIRVHKEALELLERQKKLGISRAQFLEELQCQKTNKLYNYNIVIESNGTFNHAGVAHEDFKSFVGSTMRKFW